MVVNPVEIDSFSTVVSCVVDHRGIVLGKGGPRPRTGAVYNSAVGVINIIVGFGERERQGHQEQYTGAQWPYVKGPMEHVRIPFGNSFTEPTPPPLYLVIQVRDVITLTPVPC